MGLKFQDNSKKVKAEMAKVSERGLEAALLMIEGAVKAGAPVSTGDLRDSVDRNIKNEGTKLTGQVGTPLKYGVYVEFGTGEFAENGAGRKGGWSFKGPDGEWHHTMGSKPTKFMRNGFRQNKARVKKVLSDEYGASFKGR